MKTLDEISEILRSQRGRLSPVELAEIVIREAKHPGPFFFINAFADAFPDIPLRKIIHASRWRKVCKLGISDESFDSLLNHWLKKDKPIID